MEDLELINFRIISTVGTARGMLIEAIHLAKDGKYTDAEEKLNKGDTVFFGRSSSSYGFA